MVAEGHRRYRDYTRSELRDALRSTIAGFDVYRSYVVGGATPTASDEAVVERAVERAIAAPDGADASVPSVVALRVGALSP